MATEPMGNPQRLAVCLVADEQVLDCLATSIRYLLIGLIDDGITPFLIAPDGSPAEAIAPGPTSVISFRHALWPLASRARSRVVTDVRRRLAALPRDTAILTHSLGPVALALATDLAAATKGDLVLSLFAEPDANHPNVAYYADRIAQLVAPAESIGRALNAARPAAKPVEIVPLGAIASASPAAFKGPQLTPALVYAGELSAQGGAASLIRAAKRALRDHPNLLVFIIGKGPAENSLRRLAESLDAQAAITFTGPIDHWRTALEAADIFCLPQADARLRDEPIHALATGLAIIAADGSPYDGFIDGQTALLVPAEDDAAIAERIGTLLDSPDLARRLAAAAQARARTHHSVARMAAEHVRIYRQLEGRRQTYTLGRQAG